MDGPAGIGGYEVGKAMQPTDSMGFSIGIRREREGRIEWGDLGWSGREDVSNEKCVIGDKGAAKAV
jgi:hypothetical protein